MHRNCTHYTVTMQHRQNCFDYNFLQRHSTSDRHLHLRRLLYMHTCTKTHLHNACCVPQHMRNDCSIEQLPDCQIKVFSVMNESSKCHDRINKHSSSRAHCGGICAQFRCSVLPNEFRVLLRHTSWQAGREAEDSMVSSWNG